LAVAAARREGARLAHLADERRGYGIGPQATQRPCGPDALEQRHVLADGVDVDHGARLAVCTPSAITPFFGSTRCRRRVRRLTGSWMFPYCAWRIGWIDAMGTPDAWSHPRTVSSVKAKRIGTNSSSRSIAGARGSSRSKRLPL